MGKFCDYKRCIIYLDSAFFFWSNKLITPKEEGTIEVDDAPFVITKFAHSGSKNLAKCWFTTNLGEEILLSKINPLRVEIDNQKNPRPRIFLIIDFNS